MKTEILEGNKLIAEFMEDEFNANMDSVYPKGSYGCGGCYLIENLRYHSSWDWLMPVVEKINKLFNPLTKPMFVTTAGTFLNKIYNAITDVDIQKAHEELVEAIKWYNKNNSQ